MKQTLYTITFALLLLPGISFATPNSDPTDLVKVTNENNAKCVEYFKYNNESYCSTRPLTSQTIDPNLVKYETQNIVFDDRIWQLAWGQRTQDSVTIEYVPKGDDINNWKELVTSHTYFGMPSSATPKMFANTMIKGIQDAGFNPIVTFIKQTPDQVIYEYRITSPANQIQDVLQSITKKNNNIYVLHYDVKKSDMGKTTRDQWLQNLSQSKIKP